MAATKALHACYRALGYATFTELSSMMSARSWVPSWPRVRGRQVLGAILAKPRQAQHSQGRDTGMLVAGWLELHAWLYGAIPRCWSRVEAFPSIQHATLRGTKWVV